MPLPKCRRIPFDDAEGIFACLVGGWREVEILEIWQGPVLNWEIAPRVRRARDDEVKKVMELARASFTFDRLHTDPTVTDEDAGGFKAECVANGHFQGKPLFVMGTKPAGFLLADTDDKLMVVDLIAVDEECRKKHVARDLIRTAAKLLECDLVQAGTQSTNAPAQRLYESLGMRPLRRLRTFHK